MKRSWSQVLAMRDGVEIAVDVHLPEPRPELAPEARGPALLRQTRYLRAVEYRWPFRLFFKSWFFDTQATARTRFLANGYAWVDVDVRGSGASGGRWTMPWSPAHVHDGHDLVAWIAAQPWSDGQVGGLGISYDGTCTEFLLMEQHPALKAVAPRFSLFDVWADVAAPGGIPLTWFADHWQRLNRAFDDNRPGRFVRWWLPTLLAGLLSRWLPWPRLWRALTAPLGLLVSWMLFCVYKGAKPVDADVDRRKLAKAIAEHRDNFDVDQTLKRVTYRDDAPGVGPNPEATVDAFSPHAFAETERQAQAAVLSVSGWFDGGYQRAAIARHHSRSHSQDQLLIGPWGHGGSLELDPALGPDRAPVKCRYDHDGELLRFFDLHLKRHLKGQGGANPKPVRYYTLGERAWKEADAWPPASTPLRYQLGAGRRLTEANPAAPLTHIEVHRPPRRSSTGHFTRWKSLVGMPVRYSRRDRIDRSLLTYETAALEADLEVTGHPVVTLRIAIDGADAQIFAYLEDVFPQGGVSLVTEGQLRCLNRKLSRKLGPAPQAFALPEPPHTLERADGAPVIPGEPVDLSFGLLPTSYRFARGHVIRLAIACSDVDNFAAVPIPPTTLSVHAEGSLLTLPVVRGG